MENVSGEDSMTTLSPIVTKYLLTINLQFELKRFNELTPYGRRRFAHSGTGTFEGDGLKGTVVPGAFGWTLIRTDGVWEINVRVVLRPDDDEENGIYASWMGLRHAWLRMLKVQYRQNLPGRHLDGHFGLIARLGC
jgi:hypothetical protein